LALPYMLITPFALVGMSLPLPCIPFICIGALVCIGVSDVLGIGEVDTIGTLEIFGVGEGIAIACAMPGIIVERVAVPGLPVSSMSELRT